MKEIPIEDRRNMVFKQASIAHQLLTDGDENEALAVAMGVYSLVTAIEDERLDDVAKLIFGVELAKIIEPES